MTDRDNIVQMAAFKKIQEVTRHMELKRILHVDDDADIRTIVQMALELVGQFEILQCDSGSDALARAAAFQPQLFLLDFMMPGMSGRDLARKLATEAGLGHIPFVFVTAKAEESFSKELLAEGALAVITKPFDPMTLSAQLSDIWNNASSSQLTSGDNVTV